MRSSFSRNLIPAAAILLLALLVVGMGLRMTVESYLKEEVLQELRNDAQTISRLACAHYADGSLSTRDFWVNLSVAAQISGADAVIFGADGDLILCADEPYGCEHQGWSLDAGYFRRVVEQGEAVDYGVSSSLYEQLQYVVSVPILSAEGEALGVVMVSTPIWEITRVLQRMTELYFMVALAVIVVAVVLMTEIARRQSIPLQQLAKTAAAFGHGDLDARVRLEGSHSREMEELALSFNNMASSLQKSEYQRQEFVANVSHELKTPMTTIGGYIDGILDGTIPPEKSRQYLELVSGETRRLSRLVRSMLDISRLQDQGGIPEEKKTRFDITECVGQVLITFEKKITDKNLDVDVQFPEFPAYTIADRDSITQVIYNLLDNGVKFCPDGGYLGVYIRPGGNKVLVSVANDGQTIPPEELPLVFDRFHKMDKSRSRNQDGWGLGLYIVKTIVCSHGEDISVTSKNGRTVFTFTLPLYN